MRHKIPIKMRQWQPSAMKSPETNLRLARIFVETRLSITESWCQNGKKKETKRDFQMKSDSWINKQQSKLFSHWVKNSCLNFFFPLFALNHEPSLKENREKKKRILLNKTHQIDFSFLWRRHSNVPRKFASSLNFRTQEDSLLEIRAYSLVVFTPPQVLCYCFSVLSHSAVMHNLVFVCSSSDVNESNEQFSRGA